MPIKLRIPTIRRSGKNANGRGSGRVKGLLPRDGIVRFALLGFLSAALLVVGFFAYWYVKYDRIIEQRFRGAVFASSAKIFAAPPVVRVGSKATPAALAAELRHAGYSEKEGESPLGSYRLHSGSIEVLPARSPITVRKRRPSPLCREWFPASIAVPPVNWRLMSSSPRC